MPAKTAAKRSYNSSRRTLQAAQTRDEVLRAAVRLFATTGWAGTTLAAIADEAGVSVETIYNGFGSKKGLLEAARDFSIVGDSEPVPFVERPEFHQLGEGSLDDRIAHAAAMTADIHERSALVWQAIIEAASADEEINLHRLEQEEGRRAVLRPVRGPRARQGPGRAARHVDVDPLQPRGVPQARARRRLHPRGVRGLPHRRHRSG